jgi:hypothetical protein
MYANASKHLTSGAHFQRERTFKPQGDHQKTAAAPAANDLVEVSPFALTVLPLLLI